MNKVLTGLLLVAGFAIGCGPKPPVVEEVVVTSMTWARYVDLVAPGWVTEGGWEVPEHAEKVGEQKKVHHHDTKRNYGPGMCWSFSDGPKPCMKWNEKKVPVEATWYTYQIEREVPTRTVSVRGTVEETLTWPDPALEPNEQVLRQREEYAVVFVHPDKSVEAYLFIGEAVWRTFEVGKRYRIIFDPETNTKKFERL